MRRLIVLLALLVLLAIACTFEVQAQPRPGEETETPSASLAPETATNAPENGQVLEGPEIEYKGVRFTLDPVLGSRLYVFDDVTTIDGLTAHNTRFALTPEEYCQTWCLMVYPVAQFQQAFGSFVFPPAGYRGGAAVIFQAQKKALSFQNGNGDRALEIFAQSQYPASNELLKYVFRGYTTDKQSGIFVQVPTHAASLPDAAPTLALNSPDVLEYNQRAAETMNALTPADFTPNLDLLDALVASVHVETP